MLRSLGNLIPPTHGGAKGVSEAYVFPMRPQLLHRFGVAFQELTRRLLPLLEHLAKIIYRSHLEITSIVGTCFPLIPCDHSTLFTQVPRRLILESWTSALRSSPKFA